MPRRDDDPYRTAYEREKGKWDARRDAHGEIQNQRRKQSQIACLGCLGLISLAAVGGIIASNSGRKPDAAPSGEAAPPPAAPKKANESPREQEGLKVDLLGVELGPAFIVTDGKQTQSSVDFLAVSIRVSATQPSRVYEYRSWGLANADAGTIRDAKGKVHSPPTKPNDSYPRGHVPAGRVTPETPVTDVLLFFPPGKDAGDLVLELPVLDRPGKVLKVSIPRTAWAK